MKTRIITISLHASYPSLSLFEKQVFSLYLSTSTMVCIEFCIRSYYPPQTICIHTHHNCIHTATKVLIGFDRLLAIRRPINHRSCFRPIGCAWAISALLATPQVGRRSSSVYLVWSLIILFLGQINSWQYSVYLKGHSQKPFTSALRTGSTRKNGKSSSTPFSAFYPCTYHIASFQVSPLVTPQ